MSRVRRRIQRARRFGVYVFKDDESRVWDVFNEKEWYPRGLVYTRRQAVNLAHSMTIAKQQKLTVMYGDAK